MGGGGGASGAPWERRSGLQHAVQHFGSATVTQESYLFEQSCAKGYGDTEVLPFRAKLSSDAVGSVAIVCVGGRTLGMRCIPTT